MPDIEDAMTVRVDADLSQFRADMKEATDLARRLGSALSGAFEGAIVKGKSFGDVLRDLALRIARIALDAALKPLGNALAGTIGSALTSILPFGNGGVVTPFARGGVLDRPSLFAMPRGGLGLAGEAGPEAILPLSRGPDGRLGVATRGAERPVSVTVNIQTADLTGFQQSQGQIAAQMGRAIQRAASRNE